MQKYTDNEIKEKKSASQCRISGMLKASSSTVKRIDDRLFAYLDDVAKNPYTHNIYEVLGAERSLRMILSDEYVFDIDKVHRIIKAYEGKWDGDTHLGGGLKFSGMRGRTVYRLTPVQVYVLAVVFGVLRNCDDGLRRVVAEANLFIPRKFGKTTFAAFFAVVDFLFGDDNGEVYMCANSSDQAKIAFKQTYGLLHQLDPEEKSIRFTQSVINWRTGAKRENSITALSAGGKTKDGLFASLCIADEYGSAGYVAGHCDMASLVNVVEGSMGARREPLTLITTTAGRVVEGAYEIKLRGIEESLLDDDGNSDWQFALILMPDQWEFDDDSLSSVTVQRKVNPHIGVTVQPDYYASELLKAKRDPEKRAEVRCKLFNLWTSTRVQQWITPDKIRSLQVRARVDDLRGSDGWVCFIGMDFSNGNDFNAQSYLCYNVHSGRFFADMDAWVSRDTLERSTLSSLYQQWYSDGWLRVCDGEVIDEGAVLERVKAVASVVPVLRIGYDPFAAKRFVNAIAAWIYSAKHCDPSNFLRPVKQTFGNYNAAVQELDYLIKADPALINYSDTPLWPWEFGNCVLQESGDGMGNVKPVKSSTSSNNKVDNVQCLCSALILYDEAQGARG